MLLFFVALWVSLINVVTYFTFARDKACAKRGDWRVPEAQLLHLAFIGGWPAAKLAQRRLRHKTHKMPFAARLNRVPFLQLLIAAFILWAWFAASVLSTSDTAWHMETETPTTPALPRRFGPGS